MAHTPVGHDIFGVGSFHMKPESPSEPFKRAVSVAVRSLAAEPEVLLDPNTLSSDGTVALSILAFAEDGRTMVYGTSGSGSDWQEFRVRDVTTKQDRVDHLKWIKFSSAAWTLGTPRPSGSAKPVRKSRSRLPARGAEHGGFWIVGMIGRAQQGGVMSHFQRDIAFQHNRRAEIGAIAQGNGAAAIGGAIVDRRLDRLGVLGFAVNRDREQMRFRSGM